MPYFGTLVCRVYTSRGQIPVPDAFVTVVRRGPQGDHLSAVRTSDRSGSTLPVSIETPSPQCSQTAGTPYGVCDLWVHHPGYRLMVVRDVQIFPDTVSIQELPLIPVTGSFGAQTDAVTIPPQDL